MKKTTVTLCLMMLLLPSSFRAQGAKGNLLAAPYPGSVAEPHPGLEGTPEKALIDAHSRTFYSRDPLEKVRAYYTKSLGEFVVSPGGDHIFCHDVIPFADVVAIVEKRGGSVGEGGDSFQGGAFAGVTLYGAPTNGSVSGPVRDVLQHVELAYLLRFQNEADPSAALKHADDPELKKIEARYAHLLTAYYPETKEPRKTGAGTLTLDEVIFNKHYTAPAEASAKELNELQKKMTELTMQMRYDEAAKVGERIMKHTTRPMDSKAEMDQAIKCLEELEKNAYGTMIVIDNHPSTWDLTPKKE